MKPASLQIQAKALGDPTRHRIFQYIVASVDPVGVAELTNHLELNHNAIRQHLAKLVAAKLVDESVLPAKGRGRPPLRYEIAPEVDSIWGVLGPYERLAGWLTELVRTGDSAFEVGRREGRRRGDEVTERNDPASVMRDQMARHGFQPEGERDGRRMDLSLAVCPFASAAAEDPDTICEMHRGIAVGVAESIGGIAVDELVRRDPHRGGCTLRCQLT